MTDLIQAAIDKLDAEAERASGPYIKMVAQKLIECCTSDAVAEKFLRDGKTIAGAIGTLEAEARRTRSGNMGMVDPATGYRMIMEYFGVEAADVRVTISAGTAELPAAPEPTPAAPNPAKKKIIDLADFL
jgi:hypothetical protein